ncbi:MAG: homocysteine S-methyltransferase [Steroidobacterales bacterium]
MNPIAEYLAASPLRSGAIILDGALATELEARGADLQDKLWSAKILIEQPALIRAVHLDYFRAGADVATTATYQASFEGFARRGIDAAAAAGLMRTAVELARSARDEFWADPDNRRGRLRPLVAASIGPYGAALADGSEYRGNYALSDAGLRAFHRPRLQVLAESGADLLAIETLPCEREALVLAQLVEECAPITAWIAFSCRDGMHTAEGQRIGECALRLEGFEQVAAVGINCTPPPFIVPLLRELRECTRKPLLVYPNSGETFDAVGKCWHGSAAPVAFAAAATAWRAEGARLIGGCCRTTPADIQAVRAALA